MQRTMELLKEKGIIEKIQKNFDDTKPPVGVTEETICEAIEFALQHQMLMQEIEEEVLESMFGDLIDAVRGEVNIEFVEYEDFKENARKTLKQVTDALFDEKFNKNGEGHGKE